MFRRVLLTATAAGLLSAAALHAGDAADRDSEKIPPRSQPAPAQRKDARPQRAPQAPGDRWLATIGGLTAVLALIYLTAKALRRNVPAAQKALPPEVVQALGRKSLDYRHTVHLVRCGSRLLVLGASQAGLATLAEITDPVEVDYLAGLCKPSEPAGVAQSFNQLFRRFQGSASTGDEPETETETEAGAPVEPEADPAVLRLQQRLHLAPQTDAEGASPSLTTEAAG